MLPVTFGSKLLPLWSRILGSHRALPSLSAEPMNLASGFDFCRVPLVRGSSVLRDVTDSLGRQGGLMEQEQ